MRKRLVALAALVSLQGPVFAQSLTIYTELSPPAQFLGPDGLLTGHATEIVREIQKRLGNTDPIEVVPWIRGYKELSSRPNVVLFSVARTPERDPLFEWAGPINENSYSFYVKADAKTIIKGLEEAKRLRMIGVYKEDVRDQYLTQAGFTNLDRSIDQTVMVKKLMDGRIDALASSEEGAAEMAKAAGFRPEELREAFPFLKIQTHIAFSKGTPETIVKAWSKALEAMKRDGTFERSFRKFYPGRPLPGTTVSP